MPSFSIGVAGPHTLDTKAKTLRDTIRNHVRSVGNARGVNVRREALLCLALVSHWPLLLTFAVH